MSTKPELTREIFKAAFIHSCHRMTNADERWQARREKGLTNDELRRAVGHEYGIYGGGPVRPCEKYDGWHTVQGAGNSGENPKLWVYFGFESRNRKPDLEGPRLVRYARDVLRIPDPSDKQLSLIY